MGLPRVSAKVESLADDPLLSSIFEELSEPDAKGAVGSRDPVAQAGTTLPTEFDLYSGRVCPAGGLEWGTHDLIAGKHRLRFTVAGKNPASKGFSFGLDAVDLLTAK